MPKPGGSPPGSPAASQESANSPSPVVTAKAHRGEVTKSLSVTGSLMALQEVSLSAKQGGKLLEVTVREGDTVAAGQVIARIDATDLLAQVRTAEASLTSARARLTQAEAAYQQAGKTLEADVTSARATYNQQTTVSQAQVRSAEAALASARSRLSTLQEGARPEERLQTQASLSVAESNLRKAQADLTRNEKLFTAGAISQAEIDQYRTARDVAQANLNAAKATVELQLKGSRQQEIDQAKLQIDQAEEALRQATAGRATDAVRRAALDTALANKTQLTVKQADISSARAGIDSANAALTTARQAVTDTVIRAPFSGKVASRTAQPGQNVTVTNPIVSLVAMDSVNFEPAVPSVSLSQVKVGQSVAIAVDAYPGKTFAGKVVRIYPSGSSASRTFPVRISLDNKAGVLHPHMFAQGKITTEKSQGVVLFPKEAILKKDGKNIVFVLENNKAIEKSININYEDGLGKVSSSDLKEGDVVVTLGQRTLKNGDSVTADSNQEEKNNAMAR
jgi:HlyD family secretion protein